MPGHQHQNHLLDERQYVDQSSAGYGRTTRQPAHDAVVRYAGSASLTAGDAPELAVQATCRLGGAATAKVQCGVLASLRPRTAREDAAITIPRIATGIDHARRLDSWDSHCAT